MIDRDLIELQDSNTRAQIKLAIGTLAQSGILTKQRERLLTRLAEGAEDENAEDIVFKVLMYRKQSHALIELQQIGESILEEQTDERE